MPLSLGCQTALPPRIPTVGRVGGYYASYMMPNNGNRGDEVKLTKKEGPNRKFLSL
ncbi:MAG: hypothetical protein JWQ98_3243 [Chlorobi bacterium]|nr:hypothetical protein [Chlorobiota bacterium]